MESEKSPNPSPMEPQEEGSNKISKKEAAKLERQRRRQEAAAAASVSTVSIEESDPLSGNYGDVELNDLQSKAVTGRKWTEVGSISPEMKDQVVLIRGRVQTIRPVGKKIAFVVVRERGFTVQCVLTVKPELVSPQMVKYATSLSKESIVDVEGVVTIPEKPITGSTQQQVDLFQKSLLLYAFIFILDRPILKETKLVSLIWIIEKNCFWLSPRISIPLDLFYFNAQYSLLSSRLATDFEVESRNLKNCVFGNKKLCLDMHFFYVYGFLPRHQE